MITFDDQQVAESRILVVDDNEPSALLVRALLERAGAQAVRVVTDPRRIFDELESYGPDLLIVDLHMPEVDGYAVLDRLRAQRTSATPLPIMVLTADTTREAVHLALTLGATEFVTKPVDAVELVLRVRNLLRGRIQQESLRRRQRWLVAAASLAESLLAPDCPDPIQRLCALALHAAEADVAVVSGVVGGATCRRDSDRPAPGLQVVTLTAPVATATSRFGQLELTWFGPHRLRRTTQLLAEHFAAQAAVALELAAARAAAEREQVLADRRRIARDLHDQTIQRLFATGLRLQNTAGAVGDGSVALRLTQLAEQVDDAMVEIRAAVDELRRDDAEQGAQLPAMLAALSVELTDVLGFRPRTAVSGDAAPLEPPLVADLMAVAREALSNVARHARAHTAGLSVEIGHEVVILRIVDDGVGPTGAGRSSGLSNMAERASRHDGSLRIDACDGGGTSVTWLARRAPGTVS